MNPKKTNWHLLDFDFLAAMVDVLLEGAMRENRCEDGWKNLDAGKKNSDLFFDAALRHLVSGRAEQSRAHFAAVGVNAMILFWRTKKEKR